MVSKGVFYRWAFYTPDGPALDEIRRLVDAGKVRYGTVQYSTAVETPQCHWVRSEGTNEILSVTVLSQLSNAGVEGELCCSL